MKSHILSGKKKKKKKKGQVDFYCPHVYIHDGFCWLTVSILNSFGPRYGKDGSQDFRVQFDAMPSPYV
jgi:hypothetical protein